MKLFILSKEVHVFLLNFLLAQTASNWTIALLKWGPFIAIFVIMYLMMILPQQKKQKEHRRMLDNIQKGDRIITAGGILGTVAGIKEKEKTVILKVADNTKIELLRSSVAQVLKQKGELSE
jgi:preprotein translocase subunit YajC